MICSPEVRLDRARVLLEEGDWDEPESGYRGTGHIDLKLA